ncbi:hypothetical protein RISK_002797 [Rhodopirellula islandica]|uniref:Uncharacterized protein n=1 Tax=Rhodopirellula islandica TaxID=595434 RepID=A0A0J1BET5_RHOIS|nr:hypothetical protein [Rhodopirellula islandica]KLU05035.1 hypothetical protein RISK_002797 [Rhodopirellula islandica]
MDSFSKTPRFVLKADGLPIGPDTVPSNRETETQVVFGFSSKEHYDAFQKVCSDPVTPYPLVKGYLQNQVEESGGRLQLVMLDADSPTQEVCPAATFQATLTSIEGSSDTVPVSHQLNFDGESLRYDVRRVEPRASAPASG